MAFYVPNVNDEIPNPHIGKDMIAPLWTDLNVKKAEKWTYEQTKKSLKIQATKMINIFYPNLNFSASWVFVSAWWNVPTESTLGVRVNTNKFSGHLKR